MKDYSSKKRGVLQVVFGRTAIIIISLLIQLFILIYTTRWLTEYSTIIYYGCILLGVVVAIHIMNNNDNASFKLAWIIPVLIVPVFGAIFYVFVYNQFETRAIKKTFAKLDEQLKPAYKQNEKLMDRIKDESDGEYGIAKYLYNAGRFPVYDNCQTEFFPLGQDKYKEMIKQLESAEKFIFMEYFIVAEGKMWNSILEILKKKAAEGVEVRFMYDGTCSLMLLPYGYYKELAKYGIKSVPFSQIRPALSTYQNNRDHRKILIVDGKVAFTGGINLADEYINEIERFGYWKDTAIMVKGKAVKTFTTMFLEMWNVAVKNGDITVHDIEKYVDCTDEYFDSCMNDDTKMQGVSENVINICTDNIKRNDCGYGKVPVNSNYECLLRNGGYVIPYSDDPFTDERIGKQVYIDILNRASKYVHIMTPYLILDDEMVLALKYCAKRGVETIIIMPHVPDKIYAYLLARTYYKDLLESGVKIYEYTPGFVHAKLFVSDDLRGVVGTSNLDFRSLYLHFECCMYIYKNDAISDIERDYQYTLSQSQEITVKECDEYPWIKRIAGSLLRFIAPLM